MSPADLLAPISLAELDAAAALRDRVDRKYVVRTEVAAELCRRLTATHRVLEIDGRRTFSYVSEYYDSADLGCLRDHLKGRRRRFKCRTRSYVDAGITVFEVKLKGRAGRTLKHRLPAVGGATAPQDTRAAIGPDARAFLHARLTDAYGELPAAAEDRLTTTVTVDCTRTTLVAPELGERVTLDWTLGFRGPGGAAGHLLPGWVVLESKSSGRDAEADRVLRALGCRPVPMCSKYCLGVSLTRPGLRPAALRPLLRRAFATTSRPSPAGSAA